MKYPTTADLHALMAAERKHDRKIFVTMPGDPELIERVREWRRQRATGDKSWMQPYETQKAVG